jgi:hypothetical protein
VIWNFTGAGKQQVSLLVGDNVVITDEHESGWLRGAADIPALD